MATKKKSKKVPVVWQAHPDDAIRLAALRWFALEIERLSIEIYATDKTKYPAVESLLRKTVKSMGAAITTVKSMGAAITTVKSMGEAITDESVCPPGWVLCPDRLCAPMCDWEA